MLRIRSRRAAALLATSLALLPAAACSGDDAPTTTAAVTTADPTPRHRPVWPTGSDRSFQDPVAAALAFAREYLGMGRPAISAFEPTDQRSGEVAVRPAPGGPVTRVLLVSGDGGDWVVNGATSAVLQLTAPSSDAPLSSPVTVSGRASGTDPLVAEVRAGDGGEVIATTSVAVEPGAPTFSAQVEFPSTEADRGAVVVTARSPEGDVLAGVVVGVRFDG